MASAHEGRRSAQTGAAARPRLHQAGEERPGALLAYPAREPPATASIVPVELLSAHRRGSRRLAAGANGPWTMAMVSPFSVHLAARKRCCEHHPEPQPSG